MRKIAMVAILAILLACSGMAFAFQNEPEGFRGLKWGDPPGEDVQFLQERERQVNEAIFAMMRS